MTLHNKHSASSLQGGIDVSAEELQRSVAKGIARPCGLEEMNTKAPLGKEVAGGGGSL